ncbi:hypothetical protein B0H19DRAFT_1266986 [Mycena capillaripes]|nr:hypothetical protein B0H19DRAFT_1266986 [Mycena capillaripes]
MPPFSSALSLPFPNGDLKHVCGPAHLTPAATTAYHRLAYGVANDIVRSGAGRGAGVHGCGYGSAPSLSFVNTDPPSPIDLHSALHYPNAAPHSRPRSRPRRPSSASQAAVAAARAGTRPARRLVIHLVAAGRSNGAGEELEGPCAPTLRLVPIHLGVDATDDTMMLTPTVRAR